MTADGQNQNNGLLLLHKQKALNRNTHWRESKLLVNLSIILVCIAANVLLQGQSSGVCTGTKEA